MRVDVSKKVRKKILKFPHFAQDSLSAAILELEEFPNIKADIKKLGESSYRLRVGSYRVIFKLESDLILVYEVETRGGISYAKG